ncbi:TonB-dependent receptor, partial [Compostibacter hankyongensis]|uniref:TonB-dependent receptor n=1 Tax=Compostibacter hankyongensis TaxID=1007089 RepID=UPI0031F010DB
LHASARVSGQRISLSEKNASLEEVFSEIRDQTGYTFAYAESLMRPSRRVTVDLRNATLEEALARCMEGQPLSWVVIGKTVVIRSLTRDSADRMPPLPQQPVSGRVTDSSGNPLSGVTAQVKGGTAGTVTDADGKFSLDVAADAVLVFSYLGYDKKELPVNGRSHINVVLKPSSTGLNEIVVVGYGTQKRSDITGAVESIDNKMIATRPQENVAQTLQGLSPGLNVSTNSSGGEPGATMNFNIRGMGSPYVLVDGMPMDINQVNPADIESVSVLKDAASAAIYGANAPYGVILITTKKGRSTSGKPNFTYHTDMEWATPTVLPQPANSLEFAKAWNDAAKNAGMAPIFSDEVIGRIEAFMKDPRNTPGTVPDPFDPNKWAKHENANANTNWYDALVKKWSFRQKHNLSMDGSRDGLSYYVSAGFYDQSGQMRYGDEQYQRYNIDAKINTEITKWMRVNFLTKFTRSKSDYPNDGYGLERDVMWHDLTRRYPTDPVVYPNGEYSEMSRINVYEHGGRDVYTNNDLWLRAEGELEPVKDWLIKGDYSWKNGNNTNAAHHALVYAHGPNGDPYVAFDTRTPNDIAKTFDTDNYWTFNISTSYEKRIKYHQLKLLLGYQREYQSASNLYALRNTLITDNVPSISTAAGDVSADDEVYHWSTVGAFFRFNYNFRDKYLLEVNARRSGSSKFAEDKRYGFFPSVSAAYRISEEKFWSGIKPYIGYFKLRGSYGSLGNQNVDNYLYIPIMPVTPQVGWILGDNMPVGVGMPGITSPDLTWETVRTFDLGFDAALLKERMNVIFDYFKRDVLNMLGTSYPLPSVLGTAVPLENNAAKRNSGWEASVEWKDRIGDNFSYNLKASLSDYKVVITKWNNPDKTLSSNYAGMREGDIWGYASRGLFQSEEEVKGHADQSIIYANWYPGDVRYEDLNGDGIVNYGNRTVDDHGDLKIIGNSLPRYAYSLLFGMSWKQFDLSMFWMGIGKQDVWFNNTANVFWGQLGDVWQNSTFKEHLDYWTEDNPKAYYPRPYFSSEGNKNREISSLYLQNAAYLRLKSLQVGYTLPESLLRRISVKGARVYVNAENLLTFSSIKGMFDPEGISGTYGQGKIYPLSKIISFGLNVNF